MGRSIALLFLDRGTRRGCVVSSTLRPHFTSGKDPVPILQETGWAPRPVWTGGKSRPHRDSVPDRPARSQSLYRLSYPAHSSSNVAHIITHISGGKFHKTCTLRNLVIYVMKEALTNAYTALFERLQSCQQTFPSNPMGKSTLNLPQPRTMQIKFMCT